MDNKKEKTIKEQYAWDFKKMQELARKLYEYEKKAGLTEEKHVCH